MLTPKLWAQLQRAGARFIYVEHVNSEQSCSDSTAKNTDDYLVAGHLVRLGRAALQPAVHSGDGRVVASYSRVRATVRDMTWEVQTKQNERGSVALVLCWPTGPAVKSMNRVIRAPWQALCKRIGPDSTKGGAS